jgi:predicted cation transporter
MSRNCSLTQQILSHSFYDSKLCELFLLRGFLICHAVGWYIELKNQKFDGGILFQQVVGIPMGTNCALLLADLFLYSYESEFRQKLVKDKKIHEARAFNFTYRYIDDVLFINNSRLE